MTEYAYRIKGGEIRLATGEDLNDYAPPTAQALAEYKADVAARMPEYAAPPVQDVPSERLDELIRQAALAHGCPVCQKPVSLPLIDAGETGHPHCRLKNAGRETVIESREELKRNKVQA